MSNDKWKMNQSCWHAPPEQLALDARDVHVWLASLEPEDAIVDRLGPLLSPDEQARAARFHFEIDRKHFIVARGCLRTILARYLGVAPGEIEFTYDQNGKPRLATSMAQSQPLEFNLAHSGVHALYAFTRIGEIGVDLEFVRPEFTGDEIARRFFSTTEVSCLNSLPAEARQEAFFNCWTRKEAFIKAKGIGLSLPLDQFDVTLSPGEPAALVRTRWDENEAARWSLKEIEVGPGYAGALAIEAHDWQMLRWLLAEKTSGQIAPAVA
jgi:4'-phosphopantetheinyl transferase